MIKTTAPLIILPAQFLSFEGELLPDATVKLDWKAEVDEMHDHFEVERSSNSSDFRNIGTVEDGNPYSLIDPTPNIGNNYYRIKQVDKDGRFHYSKTINIVLNKPSLVQVYPNPAKEYITVKLSYAPGNYIIQVTDAAGRGLEQVSINGSSELKLDARKWSKGIYFLNLYDVNNNKLSTERFLKL